MVHKGDRPVVNQGMIYGLGSFTAAEQLVVLDGAAALGFKIMYDLPTGPVHIQGKWHAY